MAECRRGSKVSQKVISGLGNFTKVENKKHINIHAREIGEVEIISRHDHSLEVTNVNGIYLEHTPKEMCGKSRKIAYVERF